MSRLSSTQYCPGAGLIRIWALHWTGNCDNRLRKALFPKRPMSVHSTTQSLITLLTTVMIGVQSVAVGTLISCDAGTAGAVSCRQTPKTSRCCDPEKRSCCSSGFGCCCSRSAQNRPTSVCSCGHQKPSPATPRDSRSENDVRQLLATTLGNSPPPATVTSGPRHPGVTLRNRPRARAGTNALLCVWLT